MVIIEQEGYVDIFPFTDLAEPSSDSMRVITHANSEYRGLVKFRGVWWSRKEVEQLCEGFEEAFKLSEVSR